MWLLPAQTGGTLCWLWPVLQGDMAAWLVPSPLGSIGGSCGGSLGSAAWVVLKLETAEQTESSQMQGSFGSQGVGASITGEVGEWGWATSRKQELSELLEMRQWPLHSGWGSTQHLTHPAQLNCRSCSWWSLVGLA